MCEHATFGTTAIWQFSATLSATEQIYYAMIKHNMMQEAIHFMMPCIILSLSSRLYRFLDANRAQQCRLVMMNKPNMRECMQHEARGDTLPTIPFGKEHYLISRHISTQLRFGYFDHLARIGKSRIALRRYKRHNTMHETSKLMPCTIFSLLAAHFRRFLEISPESLKQQPR